MRYNLTLPRRQRGVTLLELMIVCAIIAIIAAVGYPSYVRYVVNSKRTTATATLLQIADRQQQFFMDNKRYANDLTALGLAANPLVLGDDGQPAAAGDPQAVYRFTLSNVAATSYTATATPLNEQATRDSDCGALTYTQAAVKSHGGSGDDCW